MYLSEIEAWLENQGTTWCGWNIQDPTQRRQAAGWFAKQVNDCYSSSKSFWFTHGVQWGQQDTGAHLAHGYA